VERSKDVWLHRHKHSFVFNVNVQLTRLQLLHRSLLLGRIRPYLSHVPRLRLALNVFDVLVCQSALKLLELLYVQLALVGSSIMVLPYLVAVFLSESGWLDDSLLLLYLLIAVVLLFLLRFRLRLLLFFLGAERVGDLTVLTVDASSPEFGAFTRYFHSVSEQNSLAVIRPFQVVHSDTKVEDHTCLYNFIVLLIDVQAVFLH